MLVFPPEVIYQITDELLALEIGRLWLCGSKMLNWKLGEGGGVRTFVMRVELSLPTTWPNLVRNFPHLTRFSLYNPPLARFVSIANVDFTSLPPSVTEINTEFFCDAYHIRTALSSNCALFPNLRILKVSGFDRDEDRGFSRVDQFEPWRMAGSLHLLPPSLRHISLDMLASNDGNHALHPRTDLPPELESLEMRSGLRFPHKPSKATSNPFPETLKSFKLSLHIPNPLHDWKWLPLLPRTLQTLHLKLSYPLKAPSPEIIKNFPSLVDLDVDWEMTEESFEALPESLVSLRLPRSSFHYTANNLPRAPPNLTRWIGGGLMGEVSPEMAAALPRKLTRFSLPVRPEVFSNLPPSITFLNVKDTLHKSEDAPLMFHQPLLTNLITLSLETADASVFKLCPPRLRRLDIAEGSRSTLDPYLFTLLPATLRELSVNKLGKLNPDILQNLPGDLQSLILHGFNDSPSLTRDHVSSLPRGLKTLDVAYLAINDPSHFGLLPSRLETLRFVRQEFTVECMAALPRELRYLVVRSEREVSVDIFKVLPPRLTHLQLLQPMWTTQVTDEQLSQLPRSLVELTAPGLDNLTPSTTLAPLLPPNLNRLADQFSGSCEGFIRLKDQRFQQERPTEQERGMSDIIVSAVFEENI